MQSECCFYIAIRCAKLSTQLKGDFLKQRRLRIICTTDLHMEISGHDALSKIGRTDRGLIRLGSLIDQERDGAVSMLVDNGDFLQGTPLADDIPDVAKHPLALLMNDIRYDVVTLGNHDFDYGLAPLKQFLSQLDARVVSTNLKCATLEPIVLHRTLHKPFQDLDLTIAMIGLLPPITKNWNDIPDADLDILDIVECARDAAKKAKSSGADIVIALAHSGFGPKTAIDGMENAVWPLIDIPQIDAVVAGHTHEYHPPLNQEPQLHTKPHIQAGAFASAIGVLDLYLEKDQRWSVKSWAARHRFATECSAPLPLNKEFIEQNAKTETRLDRSLGTTDRKLTNHFAFMGHDDGIALMNQAICDHVKNSSFGRKVGAAPLIAANASFWSGGSSDAPRFLNSESKTLKERDLFLIAPFDNQFCVVQLNGREVRTWLSHASRLFLPINATASNQLLIDPWQPSYKFDVMSGVNYEINLSADAKEPNQRIPILNYQGNPLKDSDPIFVAVSTYRAQGAGGHLAISPNQIVWRLHPTLRPILRGYLGQNPGVGVDQSPSWQFSELGQTQVAVDLPTKSLPQTDLAKTKFQPERTPNGIRLHYNFPDLARGRI